MCYYNSQFVIHLRSASANMINLNQYYFLWKSSYSALQTFQAWIYHWKLYSLQAALKRQTYHVFQANLRHILTLKTAYEMLIMWYNSLSDH